MQMVKWRSYLHGLWLLLRLTPVLAWSGGAFLLAAGLAYRGCADITWGSALRLLLVAVIIQGWLAHSLNDRTDWLSGTDQGEARILSGGSGAVWWGYLPLPHLYPIAACSFGLVLLLTYRQTQQLSMYLYLLIGLWGAIAYSHAPWCLAYVPLVGEWGAAFPAIVACGLATYQGLRQRLDFLPVAGAILHGLFAVAWLMQHHLPDWQNDLQAKPPKRTTVACVAAQYGLQTARLVVVAYFLLTAFMAAILSFFSSRFVWTVSLALGCALLAYYQDTGNTKQMAWRELQMVGIILFHACLLGWLL